MQRSKLGVSSAVTASAQSKASRRAASADDSVFALVARAGRGDSAAMDELLAHVYPRVRDLVHRDLSARFRRHNPWIVSLFSTGDVVQEVFLRLIRDLPGFQGDREVQFIGWLATLVRHRILDILRAHRTQRRQQQRARAISADGVEEGAALGVGPLDAAAAQELAGAYGKAVAKLTEPERCLLRYRTVEELPWKEVAQRLHFPSDEAARFHFRKLQARLLAALARLGVDPVGSDG